MGQWLTFAHGFQHDVQAPEASCDAYFHGHGLDTALSVGAAADAGDATTFALPAVLRAIGPQAAIAHAYRSRAPPLIPA